MKKKSAYILLSASSNPDEHHYRFETDTRESQYITVRTYEEALERIKELFEEGVRAIELCGGFGEERAREIIEMTNNELVVGYAVYFPEQQELSQKLG